MGAVGMVPQEHQIFPHGRFVESTQIDAVGKPHLLVGGQGPGVPGAGQQHKPAESKALAHVPGASVAKEMFQMSAWRQVSSTLTTCS